VDVKIIRSDQRRRTVSARVVDGYFLVQAPARMSDAELQPIVEKLQQRWQRRHATQALDDKALGRRAQELNEQYFGGKLAWRSIRWVSNQDSRWGSCTPATGSIRLSHRLAEVPAFVRDYVIVHELAHLLEANHGPAFWAHVNRYPKTERARGYLMALSGEEQEEDM
jgi:predicted metal-dependent hydrolase